MGAISAWWSGLALREKRIFAAGFALVAIVAAYVLLWEPAADGVKKLERELPELRAQDASMRAMAEEATRLRAAGGNTTVLAPDQRLDAVRRSLQRAGLLREGGRATAPVPMDRLAGVVPTLSVGGPVVVAAAAVAAPTAPPEVLAEANGRVRVRFSAIDYGVWVGWLAATEGELAAIATRVSVAALAPAGPVGQVRAEALLDWSLPSQPGAGAVPARS